MGHSLTISVAICAHLSRICHIVIFPYVKFANRARRSSFEEPLVYALLVEEVHAGHGPHLVTLFVLYEAHHALAIAFVFVVLALGHLLSCHLTEGQALYDRFRGRLADLVEIEDLDAAHVPAIGCLLLADVLQYLKEAHLILREPAT